MAETQLVVFRLGAEQFAAPITRVREILRPVRVTRMPRVATFVRGLFNLRGQVLPLVDSKVRLGLAPLGVSLTRQLALSRTPPERIVLLGATARFLAAYGVLLSLGIILG